MALAKWKATITATSCTTDINSLTPTLKWVTTKSDVIGYKYLQTAAGHASKGMLKNPLKF